MRVNTPFGSMKRTVDREWNTVKKFMVGALVFFCVIAIWMAAALIGASRISRYLRESDDHLRSVVAEGAAVSAVAADGQAVRLTPYNASEFLTAVGRSTLSYRYFLLNRQGGVRVSFSDGGEYTVIDGGTDRDGQDVAYIIYHFQHHTYYFSLTGFNTYDRVCRCVSPEGFGEPNYKEGAEDAESAA